MKIVPCCLSHYTIASEVFPIAPVFLLRLMMMMMMMLHQHVKQTKRMQLGAFMIGAMSVEYSIANKAEADVRNINLSLVSAGSLSVKRQQL